MKKATYYHAGCPVCMSAEEKVVEALDHTRYEVEIVNLKDNPHRIEEAEKLGVKSLPALVIDGMPFHINYGTALSDLEASTLPAMEEAKVWYSSDWCEEE
jgi:glutaredoxin